MNTKEALISLGEIAAAIYAQLYTEPSRVLVTPEHIKTLHDLCKYIEEKEAALAAAEAQKPSNNVSYMAFTKKDNRLITPLELLMYAHEELSKESPQKRPNRAVLLFLSDEGDNYSIDWWIANAKLSEARALVEFAAFRMLVAQSHTSPIPPDDAA